MEIRIKYEHGKADVRIIDDPMDYILDRNEAICECIEELNRFIYKHEQLKK